MHDIQINTERMLLRPLKITDAEDVFEWVSDERVSRYMLMSNGKRYEEPEGGVKVS